MRTLVFLIFTLIAFNTYSQVKDVVGEVTSEEELPDSVKAQLHSPKKAALLSLIPGGGQVFNRKYWKVPIIYGLGGTTIYFAANNYKNYQLFRQTLISRVDTCSDALDSFPELTQDGVSSEMEKYQKNFELMVIASIAVYAIQIVDAAVDAHLMYFDVSDDLSLRVEPTVLNLNNLAFAEHRIRPTLGLSLKLNIK